MNIVMPLKPFPTNATAKAVCLNCTLIATALSLPPSPRAESGILTNAPAYSWWYGCSPTSAGMMMGYYDINGYGGLRYDKLVPGGVAELTTFGNSGALANQIIASAGHIADFYSDGYFASGDDVAPPHHSFNSLADFMGTSQDALSNVNGSTKIYNFETGERLYYNDLPELGIDENYGQRYSELSGMYGIYEYVTYAGYGVSALYNQPTDNRGLDYGFTLEDFQHEIDSNRSVLLHLEGHTMFGYGYDGQTIYFHDTWSANQQSMLWGTSYSGLELFSVTVLELSGGSPTPEPGTVALLGIGLAGLALRRRTEMRSRKA